MIYGSRWGNAVAFLAISGAIAASPFYALWLVGGVLADRAERRRGLALLKGE